MKLNSKLLFFIILFFIVANILDVVTAMFILPGESNPIYILTQSVAALWLLKAVIVGGVAGIYFYNNYPSKFWYFSFIYIIVLGSVLVTFGVVGNVIGILNPAVVQSAAGLSTTVKVKYYTNIVSLFMLIPYVISMVAFKVYEVTEHKIKYKEK